MHHITLIILLLLFLFLFESKTINALLYFIGLTLLVAILISLHPTILLINGEYLSFILILVQIGAVSVLFGLIIMLHPDSPSCPSAISPFFWTKPWRFSKVNTLGGTPKGVRSFKPWWFSTFGVLGFLFLLFFSFKLFLGFPFSEYFSSVQPRVLALRKLVPEEASSSELTPKVENLLDLLFNLFSSFNTPEIFTPKLYPDGFSETVIKNGSGIFLFNPRPPCDSLLFKLGLCLYTVPSFILKFFLLTIILLLAIVGLFFLISF